MKNFKIYLFASIAYAGLSSFGLVNHADLIKNSSKIIPLDSLQNQSTVSMSLVEKESKLFSNKSINKPKQEEEKANSINLVSKVAYFILLGTKAILTSLLKLFTL
jgi:hypothetical protein